MLCIQHYITLKTYDPLFSLHCVFYFTLLYFIYLYLLILRLTLVTNQSLLAQMVKNQLVMQKTCFQSLGWEDPLEKETCTHSSILSWKIP